MDSLLEKSMNVNLDSAVNVAGGSSNDRQSVVKPEAYNGQSPSFSIDEETGTSDNPIEVGNGASSNAIPHKIGKPTIITQNIFNAHNFDNGQDFFYIFRL